MIEKLSKIDKKINKYQDKVLALETELERQRNELYENYEKQKNDLFLEDSLVQIYGKADYELKKMLDELVLEYDKIYTLSKTCELWNVKIEEANQTNLKELVEEMENILDIFRKESLITKKEKFENNVYELIYKAIKKEIYYTNHSALLEKIKENETETYYINSFIQKDLKNIPKTKELKRKLAEIESKGLKSNLLDIELLKLFQVREEEKLEIEKINFSDSEIDAQRTKTGKKLVKIENKITEISRKKKNNILIPKRILIILTSSFIGSFVFQGVGIYNDIMNGTYKTKVTIYDTSKKRPYTYSEDAPKEKDSVSIIEYDFWEEDQGKYQRKIFVYETQDALFEYMPYNLLDDLPDFVQNIYLSSIPCEEKIEYTETYPLDINEGKKFIITQRVQDKTIPINAMIKILSLFVGICAYSSYLLYLNKKYPFLKDLMDLKKRKKNHEKLLKYKKELLELHQEKTATLTTLKELDEKLELSKLKR